MPRALLIGDSQAGNPAAAAKAALEAMGYSVVQVHNDGRGPLSYVQEPLWGQYVALARTADVVVLFFGHNNLASSRLEAALLRLRNGVRPPVWYTGPPQYADPQDQREGAAIKAIAQRVFGARYIDAWPTTPLTLQRDAAGFHLTVSAARAWGQAVAHRIAATASPGAGFGTAVGLLIALGAAWAAFRR